MVKAKSYNNNSNRNSHRKTNRCCDCGKKILKISVRCYKCFRKGKLNPMFGTHKFYGKRLPSEILFKIRKVLKGKDHPSFAGGKPRCMVCGKRLSSYGCIRCRFHKDKYYSGKRSPRFGKIAHPKYIKYKNIWFHSSYEVAYARYLDYNNIKWQYEPETFNLGNTTYTPDFYLPKFNLYIEIKGFWREDSKKKYIKFKQKNTIVLLNQSKLHNLGIMVK